VHCPVAESTCLAEHSVFFDKDVSVNIADFNVEYLIHCLFWKNKFDVYNFYDIKKAGQYDFHF
jgi:hypothetical protein